MVFLVLDQLLLGGFDLHLQIHQLLGEPVRCLHGGFEAGFEVLLDVSARQRIHNLGCKLFIGTEVVNVNDASVRLQHDSKASLKAGQQRVCLG